MTVQQRPTPLHPPVTSMLDLQQWIDRKLNGIERDLDEPEIAQAHAPRLQAARAVLLDVAFAIRGAVASEQADLAAMLATDTEEARWKEAGYDAMEPTIQRLMDGDR